MNSFLSTLPAAAVEAMRAHAARAYPSEACGLLVKASATVTYVPCTNQSKMPGDFFEISVREYEAAEDMGEIVGVFHSHPDAPADPSDTDRTSCQASGLPWVILSWPFDQWKEVSSDIALSADLYGRDFNHGTTDCFGFIQGWFWQKRGIKLDTPVRPDEWWRNGHSLYMENYQQWGFERVPDGEPMQEGDVLLMQINSNVPNHGAIYLDDNMIGHHLYHRLSERTVYGGYWRKHTTHVMRHKALGGGHAA